MRFCRLCWQGSYSVVCPCLRKNFQHDYAIVHASFYSIMYKLMFFTTDMLRTQMVPSRLKAKVSSKAAQFHGFQQQV